MQPEHAGCLPPHCHIHGFSQPSASTMQQVSMQLASTPVKTAQPCPQQRPLPLHSRVVCKGHHLLLLFRQLAAVAVGGQGEHRRLPWLPLAACGWGSRVKGCA